VNQLNERALHQHVVIVAWLNIIADAFLLLMGCFVFFLLAGNYYSIFPTNTSTLYKAALPLLFLGVSLLLRRSERLHDYWRIAYAFFVASAANLLAWLWGTWLFRLVDAPAGPLAELVVNNLTLFLYLTDLIPTLPQAIYDVYHGDYELMARLQGISLMLYGVTTRGMLYSVICAQDLIGQTPEDLLAAREQLPPQLIGDVAPEDIIQYGIFGICENWPVEQLDPSFKQPWESDIPTLLLEGEFDPVTPIEYANRVAEHLDNSYVFEFPGIGHDVLASSRCALSIAGDFVKDPGDAPNAVCITEMPEMAFDLPREERGEITLEPFTHEDFGLQALGPVGWDSPRTGEFVRGESAIDQTALIYDQLEMEPTDFVQLLKAQLSLPETPEPVDQIESNGFEWTPYHEEVHGVAVDVATTPFGEGGTLAMIMQSAVDEQEALHESVFLPAVRAAALSREE